MGGGCRPWSDAMRGEVRETNERNISIEGKAKRMREKKSMVMQGQRDGQAAATEGSTRGHVFLTDEVHWL